MKQFGTVDNRGVSAVANAKDIEFEFQTSNGDFVTMTAIAPTTGQLALYFARMDGGSLRMIKGAFDFLGQVLGDDDWAVVERELESGADVAVVMQIINWLVEEWTTRPTLPSNGSSTSPRRTGSRSTVTRPGQG